MNEGQISSKLNQESEKTTNQNSECEVQTKGIRVQESQTTTTTIQEQLNQQIKKSEATIYSTHY